RDIYTTRRLTESAAVGASVRAGAIDVERLTSVFDRMANAYYSGQQKDAYRWHAEFHECLIVTGTSPRLEQIVMTLLDASRRYLRWAPGGATDAETAVRLHRSILDAVGAGSAEQAASAMREHTDSSLDYLEHRRISPVRQTSRPASFGAT